MTVAEDSRILNVKVTKLEEEIVCFDSVLERVQKVMPHDLKIYEKIVHVRDVVFQLQQMLHGCEIVEFAAPWIDPCDIFWERKEEEEE